MGHMDASWYFGETQYAVAMRKHVMAKKSLKELQEERVENIFLSLLGVVLLLGILATFMLGPTKVRGGGRNGV